jgi:hypothetical protein
MRDADTFNGGHRGRKGGIDIASYYTLSDQDLRAWIDNFYTVAAANAATLGLDPLDLTAIDAARDQYVAALDAVVAVRAESKGKTANKNTERAQLTTLVATWANQFQANPAVSDQLIGELGLTVHSQGGGQQPVVPPSDLVAVGFSNGTNDLKWSTNGNEWPTSWVVEAEFDGSGVWEFIAVTTKTRFAHAPVTPGQPVQYRVRASRYGRVSMPSNVASVYTESPASLSVEDGGAQGAAA